MAPQKSNTPTTPDPDPVTRANCWDRTYKKSPVIPGDGDSPMTLSVITVLSAAYDYPAAPLSMMAMTYRGIVDTNVDIHLTSSQMRALAAQLIDAADRIDNELLPLCLSMQAQEA